MNSQRKLLFLAYGFPPARTSSSVRAWNIAKHLSKLDWDVTVATPSAQYHAAIDSQEAVDEELDELGIRRLSTDHGWTLLLQHYRKGRVSSLVSRGCKRIASQVGIESSHGWQNAVRAACSELTVEDVDVVLATAPPFNSFRIAQTIARRLNRPYVIDYRDAWTQRPFMTGKKPWRDLAAEEAKLIEGAAAVIANTPTSAAELDDRFKVGPKLHALTNGYDPDDLDQVVPTDFGHFAIVYTGAFYPPKRVITPLFEALQQLERNPSWRFHYYGPHESLVSREAERFGLSNQVLLHGNVTRAEALSAAKGAGATVVIHSSSENASVAERGVVPAKLFEAIGLGSPALLIAPHECDAAEIVRQCPTAASFTAAETNQMREYLHGLMRGSSRSPSSVVTDRYTWPVLIKKLDAILSEVIERQPASTQQRASSDRSFHLTAQAK